MTKAETLRELAGRVRDLKQPFTGFNGLIEDVIGCRHLETRQEIWEGENDYVESTYYCKKCGVDTEGYRLPNYTGDFGVVKKMVQSLGSFKTIRAGGWWFTLHCYTNSSTVNLAYENGDSGIVEHQITANQPELALLSAVLMAMADLEEDWNNK